MGGGGDAAGKETGLQKALADVGVQRLQRYFQDFVPAENMFISRVFETFQPGQYGQVAGDTAATYQREYQGAQQSLTQALAARGVDPSAGAAIQNSRALSRAAARGTGFGVANSMVDQTDRGYAGLSNVVAMGQNQAGESLQGMGDTLSQYQSQASSQAKRDLSGLQMGLEVAGTGAGMAGAYGLRMGG
jgi:hypothetical protein